MESFLRMTTIDTSKIDAYMQTDYCVGPSHARFILRIGVHSKNLDRLYQDTGQSCALFITAFNPLGTQQSDEANLTAHERVGNHLRALTKFVIEGEGVDPGRQWPAERSFLAIGIDRDTAVLLGQRAHQDAVVWAGQDAVPELLLLR
jgi:hypothetical protein